MSSSLAHGSDCAQLRTFLDADRSFGEHGNVNLLLDFVAFATIGLVVDRVAFSQLRHTGASFWPPKTVSYKATLLSRMFLLPVGAALSAYAKDREPDFVSLAGLTLILAPIAILFARFIREWYQARPRP